MAQQRVPRPRAAIEDDLRAIPAMRQMHSGCDMVSLYAQDMIDRRQDRLLDALWAGLPPNVRALATMRADRALAA